VGKKKNLVEKNTRSSWTLPNDNEKRLWMVGTISSCCSLSKRRNKTESFDFRSV